MTRIVDKKPKGSLVGGPFSLRDMVGSPEHVSFGGARAWSLAAAICVVTLCFSGLAMTASEAAGSSDSPTSSGAGSGAASVREGVQGRITFASGKPAANVFVQARSLDRLALAIPDIAILTDPAGNYGWSLSPGRYELTFIHQGRKLATRQVTVGRNGATRLDLRLSARN